MTAHRRFTLTLDCDSAAFDDGSPEVARILRDVADRIEGGGFLTGCIRDVNGNTVGDYGLTIGGAS